MVWHMGQQEIDIYCYSEKEDAGIGFGTSLETEEIKFNDEDDFDICTMGEAFWENYFEFEPGIEKARVILQNNKQLEVKQALFEVFGHFKVIVKINEKELEPEIPFIDEIEDCIYSMLEALYD